MPKIISGYISNYGQDKGKRIIQKYWIQQYRESPHKTSSHRTNFSIRLILKYRKTLISASVLSKKNLALFKIALIKSIL